MRVQLLKDARIKHSKGDIVEVSPDEFLFLTSTGQARAVAVDAAIKTPEKNVAVSTASKTEKRVKKTK